MTAIVLPIGPGLAIGQVTPAPSLAPSKDQAGPATPAEAPIGPGNDGGWLDARSIGTGSIVESRPGETIELPEPELAGMIQSFLPFDRSSIEGAIDRILDPFDGLSSSMPELRGPMGLITASLAAAATVVAVEVALRLRRSREHDLSSDDVENLTTFPGI